MPPSTITASQYITIDSLCSFEMDNYPFDVQLCKVTLRPKPNSDLFVELWGDDIRYYGPKDLMKYGDIAIQITKSNVCTYLMDDCLINLILIVFQGSSLKFEMTFKRLQLNALLTMILPAILIILVDIF